LSFSLNINFVHGVFCVFYPLPPSLPQEFLNSAAMFLRALSLPACLLVTIYPDLSAFPRRHLPLSRLFLLSCSSIGCSELSTVSPHVPPPTVSFFPGPFLGLPLLRHLPWTGCFFRFWVLVKLTIQRCVPRATPPAICLSIRKAVHFPSFAAVRPLLLLTAPPLLAVLSRYWLADSHPAVACSTLRQGLDSTVYYCPFFRT